MNENNKYLIIIDKKKWIRRTPRRTSSDVEELLKASIEKCCHKRGKISVCGVVGVFSGGVECL